MMSASEKATHKSIIRPRLSVHHESVSWTLCHEFVRSTIHLPVAATGAGLPFCEISGIRPRTPGFSPVACESKPRSRRMLAPSGSKSNAGAASSVCATTLRQQRRVVAVGGRGPDRERDAPGVYGHRAFNAPLAAIHRATARLQAAARRLRDAAVLRRLPELRTHEPVVGFPDDLLQCIYRTEIYPLVPSVTQGGRPTTFVGDPPVEAQPNTRTCTSFSKTTLSQMRARWQPRGWSTARSGNRAHKCSQRGSMLYVCSAGMEHSVPALPSHALPIGAASK